MLRRKIEYELCFLKPANVAKSLSEAFVSSAFPLSEHVFASMYFIPMGTGSTWCGVLTGEFSSIPILEIRQ